MPKIHKIIIKGEKVDKIYRLEGIKKKEAVYLAEKLFCDPINQRYIIDEKTEGIEVAYKPGVMNPEAASIMKAAGDLGINLLAADSSLAYKNVERKRIELNDITQHFILEEPKTLIIGSQPGPVKIIKIRGMSDDKLMEISNEKLFLSLEEMKIIKEYFEKMKRNPTDVELEIIAARWSEHCGHKTFKAKIVVDGKEKLPLFTRIKQTARKYFKNKIISAFEDNSGVMRFYDGQAVCGKVETHNSPSAIEPYGGAMTGSGGVFRDPLGTGQGAKLIISTDMFCFAPWDLDRRLLPPGTLSPDYLQRKVVEGVRDYGNRMGIPTANGSVHYHPDFRAKPTVIVGAYGLIPEKRAKKGRARFGDLVIVIGGKTGRDGIHGATFSSGVMTQRTIKVNSAAVQIGNAIEEKRMLDAVLEARDKNLIRVITDCGAAGFSSAIGEMGEDIGVTVDISQAPLKYPGLAPWEIWLSESQERMIVAISPNNKEEFLAVCRKYNVEATVLGRFDGSKKLNVFYGQQKVADLDYDFLKNGLPQRVMTAAPLPSAYSPADKVKIRSTPWRREVWGSIIKKVLSHGNVCSKEPIVRLYDHTVQGTNSLPPFTGVYHDGPNDALILTPILGRKYGLIQSHGLNPVLNKIDPYWGSVWAFTEAMANLTAVGGNPRETALINNYIWPYPDPESMASLDQSVEAVCDCMDVFQIPVISGKDSLSSTYRGANGSVIKIPPVLCISAFGRIKNVDRTISSDFKRIGSDIYLLGKLDDNLGGSVYAQISHFSIDSIPRVDLKNLPGLFNSLYRAIKSGNILACHDVSEGGVITTVAEMCFGGDCGVDLKIKNKFSPVNFLFNETAGTFIIEVKKGTEVKKLFKNLPLIKLGKTQKNKTIKIQYNQQNLFNFSVINLKAAWQKPLRKVFS